MLRAARFALLPALLALAACQDNTVEVPAEDLTAADAVADLVRERFERNVGAVDGFTVTGAGAEARYTVSSDTSGLEPFQVELGPAGDAPIDPEKAQLLQNQVANGRLLANGLRSAQFGGITTRDGRRAYVLSTDNPASLFGAAGQRVPVEAGQEFRIYVDAETFDLLEIYQSFVADSLASPVTQRVIYSDFRTVDGLTLPFHVRQVTTGLNQDVTDVDRMMMGGQIGMERNTLQGQPASAERDMRLAQLDAQERLLTQGVLEQELEVDEVRVGTPAPRE